MAIHKKINIGYGGISTSFGLYVGGTNVAVQSVGIFGIWWYLVMAPFWNDVMINYWDIPMNKET